MQELNKSQRLTPGHLPPMGSKRSLTLGGLLKAPSALVKAQSVAQLAPVAAVKSSCCGKRRHLAATAQTTVPITSLSAAATGLNAEMAPLSLPQVRDLQQVVDDHIAQLQQSGGQLQVWGKGPGAQRWSSLHLRIDKRLEEGSQAAVFVVRQSAAAAAADEHRQWPEVPLGQRSVALKVAKLPRAITAATQSPQQSLLPAIPPEAVDAVFRPALDPAAADVTDIRRTFFREFTCLDQARKAGARHILQMYGAGVVEVPTAWAGPMYVPVLLLELAEGGSAIDVVYKRLGTTGGKGGVSMEEAAGVILDACKGLQEGHELGMMHRDIKPGEPCVQRPPTAGHVLTWSANQSSVPAVFVAGVVCQRMPSWQYRPAHRSRYCSGALPRAGVMHLCCSWHEW